jgi:hypothetical protein
MIVPVAGTVMQALLSRDAFFNVPDMRLSLQHAGERMAMAVPPLP